MKKVIAVWLLPVFFMAALACGFLVFWASFVEQFNNMWKDGKL